jgi:hypothetical protein
MTWMQLMPSSFPIAPKLLVKEPSCLEHKQIIVSSALFALAASFCHIVIFSH